MGSRRSAVPLSVALVGLTLVPRAALAAKTVGEWDRVPSPSKSGFLGVSALSSTEAWAVGSTPGSEPLAARWDGSRWEVMATPSIAPLNGELDAVAAVATGDVWAVGWTVDTSYHPLIEHWNGATWATVAPPTPTGALHGVVALSSSDVWAVGGTGTDPGTTITMHWNGAAWSVVPSPSPGTDNELYGVTAIAADDIWAVGDRQDPSQPIETLTAHWDGSTWTTVASPSNFEATNRLTAVAAAGPTDVWAVGAASDHNGGPYVGLAEHWNGSSWSEVLPANPASDEQLSGVAVLGPHDVWAVGWFNTSSPGGPLFEHWNGSAWSHVAPTVPATGQYATAATGIPGTSEVWAVGRVGSASLTEHWYPYLKATSVRGTSAYEENAAGSSSYLSWDQNSARHPKHWDVFAETVGHSPYKVNAPGTYGYGGGIDGTRLAYQQVNRARTDSNIEFFNLATHNRSSPPGGVNTKLWEWQPSISGKWLLFGRIDFRTGTSPSQIVLFNLDTKRRTVLDHAAQRCGCIAPGQVNGHFVTWTKYTGRWHVYEYDISTGKTRVLVQPRGTDQYDAAVSASGTVYFARAGTKCGANVRLMAKPLTGPAYPLLRLPHGVDLADFHMFAYIDDVSATHLLYSRTACSRSGQGDVYRLDGITS